MKFFFVNLKRFDIPVSQGGVNRLAPMEQWGETIVRRTEPFVNGLGADAACTLLLPEAHLLPALAARSNGSALFIGAQGVHREDVSIGGNFGGFTTLRTAKAVAQMGCTHVIIGHCEERNEKAGVLREAGVTDPRRSTAYSIRRFSVPSRRDSAFYTASARIPMNWIAGSR